MKSYTTLFTNLATGGFVAGFVVDREDILSCAKVQWRAKDELRNSTEPSKDA